MECGTPARHGWIIVHSANQMQMQTPLFFCHRWNQPRLLFHCFGGNRHRKGRFVPEPHKKTAARYRSLGHRRMPGIWAPAAGWRPMICTSSAWAIGHSGDRPGCPFRLEIEGFPRMTFLAPGKPGIETRRVFEENNRKRTPIVFFGAWCLTARPSLSQAMLSQLEPSSLGATSALQRDWPQKAMVQQPLRCQPANGMLQVIARVAVLAFKGNLGNPPSPLDNPCRKKTKPNTKPKHLKKEKRGFQNHHHHHQPQEQEQATHSACWQHMAKRGMTQSAYPELYIRACTSQMGRSLHRISDLYAGTTPALFVHAL